MLILAFIEVVCIFASPIILPLLAGLVWGLYDHIKKLTNEV